MQLANVNKSILLLVLYQVQFQAMRLLLNLIIRLFQFGVEFFVLISPVFLLLEDLAMVLVLVSHLLRFLSQFRQLTILFLDIALRFSDILLEFRVKIDEHVLPVEQLLLTIGENTIVTFNFFGERFCHISELSLGSPVGCD